MFHLFHLLLIHSYTVLVSALPLSLIALSPVKQVRYDATIVIRTISICIAKMNLHSLTRELTESSVPGLPLPILNWRRLWGEFGSGGKGTEVVEKRTGRRKACIMPLMGKGAPAVTLQTPLNRLMV